jgi:hypothetical protein
MDDGTIFAQADQETSLMKVSVSFKSGEQSDARAMA